MKRFFQISGIALLIMLFAGLRNPASAQPGGDVSYQNFYDELSPYGRWIDYPEYGYVWCPDEGADFRPYSSNGRWVWSDDYEWMWVSDYSWGWAPFHYGRWFQDEAYGWMWMPGYDWSPAWVAWRGGGEYYGWAPLRPGINISVGFSIGSYSPPASYWCFAPSRYITSPRVYDYCVNSGRNLTIINNTTIINNYNYNRNVFVTGPRRNEVERFTNQRINAVRVRDISNPGRSGFRNNEVSVYRPGIQRGNNRTFAPREFDQYGNTNRIAGGRQGNRNGAGFENRNFDRQNANNNPGRREGFNNNRFERDNENRFGRRNNESQPPVSRPVPQADVNRFERRVPEPVTRNENNGNRERGLREVFGRDNRPGIDQPVRRQNFERRNEPDQNVNRMRNDNGFFNRGRENNSRMQEAPARQERRDVFNNRGNNQPQQMQPRPSQSAPQFNQRSQPQQRNFGQPQFQNRGDNGRTDNNRNGGFGRGRRG